MWSYLKDCYKVVARRWKNEISGGSKSLESFPNYTNIKTVGLNGSLVLMLLTLKQTNS